MSEENANNYENVFRSPRWMVYTNQATNLGKYAGIVTGVAGVIGEDLDLFKIGLGAAIYVISAGANQLSRLQHNTNAFSELEKNIVKELKK